MNDERNLNPAVADYVKGKKTKLIKVKVADLDDEAIDDRFGRVIDTDPDVGVDLNNPILLDKDGKTILDGFHRVYQAKRVGKEFIPAEIIENKMDLKLVNQEISEARLYRTSSAFGQLTGKEIAELLYLNTLITYLLYKTDKQSDYAVAVAKQSTQYGKYTLFRSHATDMYLLAYMVSDPENRNIKLKNHLQSRSFLKSLQFDKRRHWQFLQSIGNKRATDRLASPYLFRLESQLKIKNSMYKQWRRLTMDWEKLKYTQRQYLITKLTQEIRKLGRGSEVMAPLTTMLKYRRYRVNKELPKPMLGKKVAGAVAGAVVGRVAGKKIAKKLGKDPDKYKKYGTGLGAIAGYWAGGRQRQK